MSENTNQHLDSESTCPSMLTLNISGFRREEDAQELGGVVGNIVKQSGRFIDISLLEGITVAFAYEDAFIPLEKRAVRPQSLSPTITESAAGVAMAVPVYDEDSNIKSHIVLNANVFEGLICNNGYDKRQLAQLLVHELSHVYDLKRRMAAFPDELVGKLHFDSRYDYELQEAAEVFWEEYSACRIGAPFWEFATNDYLELILPVLKTARAEISREVESYRIHGDIQHLFVLSARICWNIMKYSSYLLGHLHGLGKDGSETSEHLSLAAENSYFSNIYYGLEVELVKLWDKNYEWGSGEIFDGLRGLAKDFLREVGLNMKKMPDGDLYIDVPF